MSAKEIEVKPIKSKAARELVKRVHYSGSVAANSQLHLGVFYKGRLEGCLQFGPPIAKRKVIDLVENTGWNDFLELNRMAFSDVLPRNSESRAIAVSIRLIRKHYPHIKWILSFSDATQCGDGTIYRASGFKLTQIKENKMLLKMPDGVVISTLSISNTPSTRNKMCDRYGIERFSGAGVKPFLDAGAEYIKGYQLRYIYLIDKSCKINAPIIPFSKIDELGAGMYRGEKITLAERKQAQEVNEDKRPASSRETGGSSPTLALNKTEQ